MRGIASGQPDNGIDIGTRRRRVKKTPGVVVSTPGEKEHRGGYVYDSSMSALLHAASRTRFQKFYPKARKRRRSRLPHRDKRLLHCQMTTAGSRVNLTPDLYILRGTNCRDGVPGLGGSDATLAEVPRGYSYTTRVVLVRIAAYIAGIIVD